MGYHTLTFQSDDKTATIALTVPEKRNAISTQMIIDLLGAFDQAETSAARVVILTGAGKAFCAGMDLTELQHLARQTQQKNLEDARRMTKLLYRLYSFPKPLIAAVNGPAIAGGCGLATVADFVLAVPEAKFGYTEVRIGFTPALVSVFLRRRIGDTHVRDLLLTGRVIDAEEAHRLGLVTEVVPTESLMDRAKEIAAQLLAASPTAVAQTKKLLIGFDRVAIRAELEAAIETNADIRSTPDFKEGVASFLEKRPPKWSTGD
ncbi:MAG TPA: enoyl-CoA hydratase-related protein [Candidatus Acidoferrales bacterium]|jgi:methylglutaconyl-CoA hydratase|nr:enoyl-CoA hydratase-related protein [Candidatus Acidoferrales bacterium]